MPLVFYNDFAAMRLCIVPGMRLIMDILLRCNVVKVFTTNFIKIMNHNSMSFS